MQRGATAMGLISFVVTGCARSATGYTAKAIEQSGVYCSHERVFGNKTVFNGQMNVHKSEFDTWGESSWWAARLVDKLPEQVAVLHQVRNPIKVIRSFWTLNLRAFKWIRHGMLQVFEDSDDDLLFYIKHWIAWNKLIESRQTTAPGSVYYRYRIEDLCFPNSVASKVAEIAGVDPGIFSDTLSKLKKDINHRKPKSKITWRDVPESTWKAALCRLAARYGYTEEELALA